jgi:nickel/cobalt exporter
MMDRVTLALMLTAGTVGALHSLAPDHWLPFAALARARHWTPLRTARLAFLCAAGHVTVSALFGVLAVIAGRRTVEALGTTLSTAAPLLLIGFGIAYMLWALHHAVVHGPHHHHRRGATEWGLFLLFCADPCVALIPMIVAASAKGWGAVGGVIAVYEAATIAAIVILVQTAHAGARRLRFAWFDRYGDVVAGAMIVIVGALVTVIGI